MHGPLSNFRVIEMGGIGPTPFAGSLLGDMGADVLRIERLGGPPVGLGPERRFDFPNRNKRSVALDLKQPAAVRAVLKLMEKADILIEGFRPGVMERLGLGPEPCRKVNPRLVYGRMTGWGQDGPLAQEAGHDINYLSLTGALYSMGLPDRPPSPPLNLVADLGGGALYLTVGVLAAAIVARQMGTGQTVDAAMIDGVNHLMSIFQGMRQQGVWSDRRAENLIDGGAPFYGCYVTGDDKYVAVGAIEPQFYVNLLAVMGLDPARLPEQNDRSAWPEMRKTFAEIFRARTRDAWVEASEGRDTCLSPVLSIDEAPGHPQFRSRAGFADFDGLRHPSPAPRFDRTPSALSRPSPAAGQHSREALANWGIEQDEIDGLAKAGALTQT